MSVEQSAQFRSPGATRSTVRPFWANPPEEIDEMLSSAKRPLPTPGTLMPPYAVCRYPRNVVVAPTAMTLGSVAGDPMVLWVPASPEATTTVTPAATAASSAILIASSGVSGRGFVANDSLSTFTPLSTASSIAWMIEEIVAVLPKPFSASSVAPGASPWTRMSHPMGRAWEGGTNWERS